MISFDTNIVFAAVNADSPLHDRAFAFIDSLSTRTDVIVSEIVLLELFVLLRNPAVVSKPLNAKEAGKLCDTFRQNPRWQCVSLPPEGRRFHDALWALLSGQEFARRRAYDIRLALSLIDQSATDFATVNLKDFSGIGFKRVWNPLGASPE
jgi:uncharacterized protein